MGRRIMPAALAALAVCACIGSAGGAWGTSSSADAGERDGGHSVLDRFREYTAAHKPSHAWTRGPTTWERIFGQPRHETWLDWLGQKGADLHVTRPPSRGWLAGRTSGFVRGATFTFRMAWLVFTQLMSSGLDVGLFAYDCLGFILMWSVLKSTLFGTSISVVILSRSARVARKAWQAIIGEPGLAKRERNIRLLLALTVLSPMVVAAFCIFVVPAMLLSVAAKNALPAAVGFTVMALVHAMLHPPLSWFVNETAVLILLNCYRVLVAGVIWTLSRAAYSTLSTSVSSYRTGGTVGEAASASGGVSMAAGGGAAPMAAGAAGMAPQQQALAATTGVLGLVNRGLFAVSDVTARAEQAVDERLEKRGRRRSAPGEGGSQPQPQPQQQAGESTGEAGGRGGGRVHEAEHAPMHEEEVEEETSTVTTVSDVEEEEAEALRERGRGGSGSRRRTGAGGGKARGKGKPAAAVTMVKSSRRRTVHH
jgi:hypothetical protein